MTAQVRRAFGWIWPILGLLSGLGAFANGLKVAGVCFILSALVALPPLRDDLVRKGQSLRDRTLGIWLFAIIAVTIAGVELPKSKRAAESQSKDESHTVPALLASIREADPSIVEVDGGDDNVQIIADLPEQSSEPEYISASGALAAAIGHAVQHGAREIAPGVKKVNLTVRVPKIDRLGDESHGALMNVWFDVADLKAAKFDNLGPIGALGLATRVEYRTGREAAIGESFCEDPEHRAAAANFCRLTDNQMQGA